MAENRELGQLVTGNEGLLLSLWKDILAMEDISVESNFFEVGGDSLQMMTLLFRVSQETGIELDPGSVFDNPTISQLALFMAHIQRQSAGEVREGTI